MRVQVTLSGLMCTDPFSPRSGSRGVNPCKCMRHKGQLRCFFSFPCGSLCFQWCPTNIPVKGLTYTLEFEYGWCWVVCELLWTLLPIAALASRKYPHITQIGILHSRSNGRVDIALLQPTYCFELFSISHGRNLHFSSASNSGRVYTVANFCHKVAQLTLFNQAQNFSDFFPNFQEVTSDGLELTTFRLRDRCSNHWATGAGYSFCVILITSVYFWVLFCAFAYILQYRLCKVSNCGQFWTSDQSL